MKEKYYLTQEEALRLLKLKKEEWQALGKVFQPKEASPEFIVAVAWDEANFDDLAEITVEEEDKILVKPISECYGGLSIVVSAK